MKISKKHLKSIISELHPRDVADAEYDLLQDLGGMYSDMHKELYGRRPKIPMFKTVEEAEAAVDEIWAEYAAVNRAREEQEQQDLEYMEMERRMQELMPGEYDIELPMQSGMGRRTESIMRNSKNYLRRIIREALDAANNPHYAQVRSHLLGLPPEELIQTAADFTGLGDTTGMTHDDALAWVDNISDTHVDDIAMEVGFRDEEMYDEYSDDMYEGKNMRITKKQLRRIIKEERTKLEEDEAGGAADADLAPPNKSHHWPRVEWTNVETLTDKWAQAERDAWDKGDPSMMLDKPGEKSQAEWDKEMKARWESQVEEAAMDFEAELTARVRKLALETMEEFTDALIAGEYL